MKHYTEVKVPEATEQQLDKTTCDLCKEEITGKWEAESMFLGKFKSQIAGNVDQVKISHRRGDADYYGDLAHLETTEVDMCGDCFIGELLPWLEKKGVKPNVKNF